MSFRPLVFRGAPQDSEHVNISITDLLWVHASYGQLISLLCGEKGYETETMNHYTSVRESLRPHSSVGGGWEAEEIVFHYRNTRLSISDNFTNGNLRHLPISAPESLFSLITRFTTGEGELNTSYLYYKNDRCVLRDVGPSGIIRIGESHLQKNQYPLNAAVRFNNHKRSRRVIFHGRESL